MTAAKDEKVLQEALIAVRNEVGTVAKDATNDFHKYKYASAEAVLNKVRAACGAHGVAITSATYALELAGENNRIVSCTLTLSKGAASATFSGLGEGSDKGDKGTMKANTAALKYALQGAFLISWGDDPEASAPAKGETKKKSAPKRKKQPTGPALDPDFLMSSIEAAPTQEALDKIRKDVGAAGFDDATTDRLAAAWKARKQELAK